MTQINLKDAFAKRVQELLAGGLSETEILTAIQQGDDSLQYKKWVAIFFNDAQKGEMKKWYQYRSAMLSETTLRDYLKVALDELEVLQRPEYREIVREKMEYELIKKLDALISRHTGVNLTRAEVIATIQSHICGRADKAM